MTIASTIVDAAINRSLANDSGSTSLASNRTELLGHLDRLVQYAYTLAGLPAEAGGVGIGDYFSTTQTVNMGTPATTFVNLPSTPRLLYVHSVTNATGAIIDVTTLRDLRAGYAAYPPAVIIANDQIRSAGRTGDPTAAAILTLDASYLPGTISADSHTVGATTPATPSTSTWPEFVGDQWLIDSMAVYLAIKDATRDQTELAELQQGLQASADALGAVISVAGAKLAALRDT